MKEKAPFIPPKKVICSEENTITKAKSDNSKIKESDIYKRAFVRFEYFNKYQKKFLDKINLLSNPHSFYNEIDKKEEEFNNLVHKMDAEYKKELELNKKKGGSFSSINKIKNKVFSQEKIRTKKRKNTYQIGDKDIYGLNNNINPIIVNKRKQSNV